MCIADTGEGDWSRGHKSVSWGSGSGLGKTAGRPSKRDSSCGKLSWEEA